MKDWELYLALNNPLDPIHAHIEAQLDEYDSEGPSQEDPKPKPEPEEEKT